VWQRHRLSIRRESAHQLAKPLNAEKQWNHSYVFPHVRSLDAIF
jgi:hypothetical protein